MDASGIGESLLSVLEHACRFFAAPGAQVIPCALQIHGALGWVGMPNCHGSLSFDAFDPFFLSSRRGGPFAVDATSPPPQELHCGQDVSPVPPSLHSGRAPFTPKNLNRLKRGEAWDLLSAQVPLLNIDIASALEGKSLHPCEAEVELTATGDGVVNCISWWWSASLDEHQTISNRPLQSGGAYRTHWLQPFVPVGPVPVRRGDKLKLRLSISDNVGQKFAWRLSPATTGGPEAWLGKPRVDKTAIPRPPPEPLVDVLKNWPSWIAAAVEINRGLVEKRSQRGDLEALEQLQQAVLVITMYPALFGCDPHVRDRLLGTFYGNIM
eukprot:gnl/TRDRNA2_/TRDRNA2_162272_c0_seq1.p1 gnl/TRDRNA2_/TRDRNA2_162272_c0~~gnl/TRDRNA2_/TRDRNA2_162272_c0_seq1.p1  ORF type:complete len:344 (-),score=53.12 gnl/TRDRNA2_/TRDRNA2_162272_c0_seq1:24-995(-)